ncbi:MAG: thioredoxin fold domain-containing protein [Campylobacterota bacterium]|nr:thioredoxin fold domain-containing protein [Campylobacterota bacterium]
MKRNKIKILILLLSLNIFLFGDFINKVDQDIDFKKLTAQSIKENKQLLIFFHTTYCPYCERMKDRTFNDKEVKELLKKDFIFVDINIDDDGIVSYQNFKDTKFRFGEYLDLSIYPVVFLVEDEEISYEIRGYKNSSQFRKYLKYFKTKSYEELDFDEFKE